MIERKKTKEVRIGNVMVGGDHAVTVQSMTTTKTHDVTATLKEVERLEEAGPVVQPACRPRRIPA